MFVGEYYLCVCCEIFELQRVVVDVVALDCILCEFGMVNGLWLKFVGFYVVVRNGERCVVSFFECDEQCQVCDHVGEREMFKQSRAHRGIFLYQFVLCMRMCVVLEVFCLYGYVVLWCATMWNVYLIVVGVDVNS